jgi:hypothetical protein
MKQLLIFAMLLAMITPSIALCQEQQPRQPIVQPQIQPQGQQPRPAVQTQAQNQVQQRTQELALRERELSLQQKQNELDFQREKQKIELDRLRQSIKPAVKKQNNNDKMAPLLLILLVVNILCAVWVYQDIRRLNAGSGIWIVIALLTGLLGTLVYAIVRIGGDIKIKS